MLVQKNIKKTKTSLTLSINKNRCPENHPCPSVKVCPTDALSQQRFEAPQVNMDHCIQCGKCVKFCPMQALILS
jgi:Fe-S-cluster-containing hydrogenase component 2